MPWYFSISATFTAISCFNTSSFRLDSSASFVFSSCNATNSLSFFRASNTTSSFSFTTFSFVRAVLKAQNTRT